MNPSEYAEYCRCWQVYLGHIHDEVWGMNGRSEGLFPRSIRESLAGEGVTVSRWPTVWPNVQYMFSPMDRKTKKVDYDSGTAKFVEAVQRAEKVLVLQG
jgi:hypothetical protein